MLSDAEARLLKSLVRLNTLIMAGIGALLVGAGLWLATVVLLMRGGESVGRHLSLLSIFLPYYDVSWAGSLIGALWGGVVGAISSAVVYWSYSRTLRHRLESRFLEQARGSLFRLPTFLISGPAL